MRSMFGWLVSTPLLLLAACSRAPMETPVQPAPSAAVTPASATPVAPDRADLCPDGRPRVIVAPCPGKDVAEALHCPGRFCREGTVWNGKACVPPCGAPDGG